MTTKRSAVIEEDLQEAVSGYLLDREVRVGDLTFCHIPNEGEHKAQYRKKQRRQGVRAGAPDVPIWLRGGRSMVIELKTLTGVLSDAQEQFHERLVRLGHEVHTVYAGSKEDAVAQVEALLPPIDRTPRHDYETAGQAPGWLTDGADNL